MDDADSDEESHISFVQSKSNCIDSDTTGITCGLFRRRVMPFRVFGGRKGGTDGQIRRRPE